MNIAMERGSNVVLTNWHTSTALFVGYQISSDRV